MGEFEAAGCTGKARFGTYHEAQRIQDRRVRMRDKEYQKVEAYRCKVCHGWHLGTKTEDRPKRLLREFLAKYDHR